MSTFILGSGAIALYLLGWAAYVLELCNKGRVKIPLIQVMTGLGIILHGITTFGLLLNSGGLDLSLLKILSLLALVINGLVFLSSLKEPIHSLYLALLPISAITLVLALISSSTKTTAIIPYSLQAHILTSIVAYSFLAIAALQALLATKTGNSNTSTKMLLCAPCQHLKPWKNCCLSLSGWAKFY